jgi:hypothetical protein
MLVPCLHSGQYMLQYTQSFRPILRREDNIKVVLSETGWSGINWIHLAQDTDQWQALVNTAMNLRVP